MIIRITKIKELDDALHKGNIEEGFVKEIVVPKEFKRNRPEVGERFPIWAHWSTSAVQEIIDDNHFRTYNSIYKWETIKDKDE